MNNEGKSLNDQRNEAELDRLLRGDYPVEYVKYRWLYAKYNSSPAPSIKHLSPTELEELRAFRKQRSEIDIPKGYSEGFYERFWGEYEVYNQQNETRISPKAYWTMIGSQCGLNFMFLEQAMDTDIIDEIARELLFIQTFSTKESS
ncbi:hypothetical protein IPM65_06040 [Candidatus Roizmanbacteria bacterium]|nr:MAG: hypothetical protein IPM65_06040 [Candidatus Roizmanbacteria bacterium]